MRIITLVCFCLTSILSFSSAEESLLIDYTYEGGHGVDFGKTTRGPIKVGEINDTRDVASPEIIVPGEDGYISNKPLSEVIRSAIIQGLESGDAKLVEEGQNFTLTGDIISSEAQVISGENGDSIRLTIRTNLELRDANRTVWSTVIFGRGTALVSEGFGGALGRALDRTVNDFIGDTYFQIEVL